ncbi:cobyric acid synthase [Desulfosarcina alkanivorans]|uniref:Cobyric acid synthase n=1 Tax=Desulfosarcina alkanivorans TaxID=571177 RepID=A0A5K7YR70_9BACT|nr:cobyric acid synthase [Desulfosarcina alkanivorans]BBO72292.1 cobyric acid synthase [Desulfosarcina alkanivorans]
MTKQAKTKNTSPAPCLAVLGTGSDVGKSVIAAALCRIFADRGLRVAPYKAQNMSNNSGVTPEGLEMGRAQIVQAEAAGIAPHVDMNPILLKPTSDVGSQVVLLGEAIGNQTAMDYHRKKVRLVRTANAALDRLRDRTDLVVMEGAGSCAEVNLMAHDIVNLPMADYADAPVILVGDIHRGGIFAQLVGTLECLPPHFRARVAGFIINRFRGDLRLFADGVQWIEEKTGLPVFGVVPWYDHIRIDPEDSVVIERPAAVSAPTDGMPAVAVIRTPHISNFTDFDPLKGVAGMSVHFLETPQDLAAFAAVILPGSKNTRFDLEWLNTSGWQSRIAAYRAGGGHITGICGGYQMMGLRVHDPDGLEGAPGTTDGLGLLPVETVLRAPKTTTVSRFSWDGIRGSGYEIHMGHTRLQGGRPLLTVTERNGIPVDDADGCTADHGRTIGSYMHGLFDTPALITRWLTEAGLTGMDVPADGGLEAKRQQYALLAEHVRQHVDVDRISELLKIENKKPINFIKKPT